MGLAINTFCPITLFCVIGNFVPITQNAPRRCAPRGVENYATHLLGRESVRLAHTLFLEIY